MKTTLNIPDDLIKEAMTTSKSKTKKELIRQKKIEKVLSLAGKLEFSDTWNKARHEEYVGK
ncbi:MAG: type II toxin-antitoxin system VapB family antitoxin [Nitrospirae bacterium]|nr:type II toxin-antitoxin system VapB family antitoxin [Nitrospirota bacterium]